MASARRRSTSGGRSMSAWTRRRERSRPDRETCGLRNSRTTASRSSSGKRRALRSAKATASAPGSTSSASDAAYGYGRGRRRDPATSRPSVRRSRSVRPPTKPVRCSPESRPGSSASWWLGCAERSACSHPLTISWLIRRLARCEQPVAARGFHLAQRRCRLRWRGARKTRRAFGIRGPNGAVLRCNPSPRLEPCRGRGACFGTWSRSIASLAFVR